MIVLVMGGNGSGKSSYAEKISVKLAKDKLYYIACMIPHGEEGRQRVQKHIIQRDGMGFETMEKPYIVSNDARFKNACVLLEDVSNLLANNMFAKEDAQNEHLLQEVYEDICKLTKLAKNTVIVTISGLHCEDDYDKDTCLYIDKLNMLNDMLTDLADCALVMRDSKAVFIKGDADEIF